MKRSTHQRRGGNITPGSKGSMGSLEILDAYSKTIEAKIGHIGGYKVVVDPGNGATCATLGLRSGKIRMQS